MRGNPELQGKPSGTVASATDHALCPYMGSSLISEYLRWSERPGCAGADRRTSGEDQGSWEQVSGVGRKSGYEGGEWKWVSKSIFELQNIQEKYYAIY